jgi:hypothetical protein
MRWYKFQYLYLNKTYDEKNTDRNFTASKEDNDNQIKQYASKNQDLPTSLLAIVEPTTGSPSKQSIHHIWAQLHGAKILDPSLNTEIFTRLAYKVK